MKVYRVLYERVVTEQMDLPHERVGDIYCQGSVLTVTDKNGDVLAVIPSESLIGCGLIELPDPAPKAEPTE